MRNLPISSFLDLPVSKKATLTMLSYYGRPNEVLALSQVLNKKSREFCKQEKGFKGKFTTPSYFYHLSMRALQWEDELIQLRLTGKLHNCK